MFCVFRNDNIAYDNWALVGIRSMYYFISCPNSHPYTHYPTKSGWGLPATREQKKKGTTKVISATNLCMFFLLASPQFLAKSEIWHTVEMSVFTSVARSRLLIMIISGSVLLRLIEHFPYFRVINSTIHQNPTERLSH